MNSSFGTDFSHVNIHTNTDAAQMNKELSAQAFTHGSDIYFNNGKYNTETSGGKQLLAHELTHVIQQKGDEKIQRQKSKKEPWIKKVSVNLTPLLLSPPAKATQIREMNRGLVFETVALMQKANVTRHTTNRIRREHVVLMWVKSSGQEQQ